MKTLRRFWLIMVVLALVLGGVPAWASNQSPVRTDKTYPAAATVYSCALSSDRTLTTSQTGLCPTNVTVSSAGTYLIDLEWDLLIDADGGDKDGIFIGELYRNGYYRSEQAVQTLNIAKQASANSDVRIHVHATWILGNQNANDYYTFSAYKTSGSGSSKLFSGHTRMSIAQLN